ncbi:MAG: hypothetical protein LBS09_00255 [Bacteroidales bacterium]|jgi:hypothetical protein|nr:hypothetical protein [Bacteroidales bacterium]
MKKTGIVILLALTVSVSAQEPKGEDTFKPHYAGMSVNTGIMFSPLFGSACFFAPEIGFQVAPRLFLNAGAGVVQYGLTPGQRAETSKKRSATGMYIYAEGVYLLNEKWSANGSMMKNVSPSLHTLPYGAPREAIHIGIDYRITPHITIGASVGYSNGGRVTSPYSFPVY